MSMQCFHPEQTTENFRVDQDVTYNWAYDNDRQRLTRQGHGLDAVAALIPEIGQSRQRPGLHRHRPEPGLPARTGCQQWRLNGTRPGESCVVRAGSSGVAQCRQAGLR